MSVTALLATLGRRIAPVLVCTSMASAAFGLEGGSTSTSEPWQDVEPHTKPDASARADEKATRAADVQAEIARLQERLTTTPSAEKMQSCMQNCKRSPIISAGSHSKKWSHGIRSIQPMLRGQKYHAENLLAALKQLNEDFKARDIDFIFVPLVPYLH